PSGDAGFRPHRDTADPLPAGGRSALPPGSTGRRSVGSRRPPPAAGGTRSPLGSFQTGIGSPHRRGDPPDTAPRPSSGEKPSGMQARPRSPIEIMYHPCQRSLFFQRVPRTRLLFFHELMLRAHALRISRPRESAVKK